MRGYRAENRELRKDMTQLASRVLALETSHDYAAKDIEDLQKSNKALNDSLDALRTSQNAQQAALVAQPVQDGVIMSADGAKKPRKVLVTLKNAQQVIAVLRAARILRDRNIKAKEAGELPIWPRQEPLCGGAQVQELHLEQLQGSKRSW